MSRHRAEPPPRLRHGRIVMASVSVAVTVVALLGGIGVIPINGGDAGTDGLGVQAAGAATRSDDPAPGVTGLGSPQTPASTPSAPSTWKKATTKAARTTSTSTVSLPAGTGAGRRVVFSEEAQRVWLVDAGDKVVSTYLVSGSLTDNLHPGHYNVYSRSRWAVGVDDSGVMQYFVRFTRGDNAAIGFHSIPTKLGKPLQTVRQLGSPQSHGCIRQKMSDAERMWDFAPVGTRVVVV